MISDVCLCISDGGLGVVLVFTVLDQVFFACVTCGQACVFFWDDACQSSLGFSDFSFSECFLIGAVYDVFVILFIVRDLLSLDVILQ